MRTSVTARRAIIPSTTTCKASCVSSSEGGAGANRSCEPDHHKFLIESFVAPNDAWVFEFKYPQGVKVNSEAYSVAPDGSKFWIVEKTEAASAKVFESANLYQTNATDFYREIPVI